jgi:hypothetical protein
LAVDPTKFLELSRALNALPLADKFTYHAVRYKFFHDNSARRHNCTYAKLTRQQFVAEQEGPKLEAVLRQLGADQAILLLHAILQQEA